MMIGRCFAIATTVLLGLSVTAFAQTTADDRWFISINGSYGVDTQTFDDRATFVANAEEGRFETSYTKKSGPMLDVSGGFLVRPRIGVGAAVSHYSRSTPVTVEASVPHPFYFDRMRPIAGDVGGLTRKELGIHLHASGVFPVSPSVTITLSGGPSYFGVSQDVVTSVAYAEAFPFDDARFERAETAKHSRSAIGVNAGGDLAIFLTPRAGIGIAAQFARATVDMPSANGQTTRMKVGGVSTGAGLRLRF
jgi:hypothetical protein